MVVILYCLDFFFEFKLFDFLVVNVFVFFGGYVYFIRGIMVYFNNEVQFAGVFGYEIGYVMVCYLVCQYSCMVLV